MKYTGEDYNRIRKEIGYSCQQMAYFIGVNGNNARNRVRDFESGRREPSEAIKRVYYLCDFVNRTSESEDERDYVWERIKRETA